jgi:hypothetical protein
MALICADRKEETFLPLITADGRASNEIGQNRRNWQILENCKSRSLEHGGSHLRSALISVIGVNQR